MLKIKNLNKITSPKLYFQRKNTNLAFPKKEGHG